MHVYIYIHMLYADLIYICNVQTVFHSYMYIYVYHTCVCMITPASVPRVSPRLLTGQEMLLHIGKVHHLQRPNIGWLKRDPF